MEQQDVKMKRVFDVFTLVTKEEQTSIVFGDYLVTEKTFTSEKAAEEYLAKKPWDVTLSCMAAVCRMVQQMDKPLKKKKEDGQKATD